jgi:hypothetical protein
MILLLAVASSLFVSGCSPATPQNTPVSADSQDQASQPDYAGKKIVFVDSYHKGYAWSDGIESGIHEVLDDTGVELKIVRLDTKQNPGDDFGKAAASDAKSEIEAFNPDVVIACDDNAQKYLVVPYFKDSSLPVVFCGVNWDATVYGYPTSNVTGMIEVELPDQLVELLKAYSEGEKLGYLSIDTETERKIADTYNQRFFDGQMQTFWVTTQDEFKEAFLAAQQEVDILFMGNNAGSDTWDEAEMQHFILENTTIPTGSINDWMAPFSLLTLAKSSKEQGDWAAQSALSILDGTSVTVIAVAENKKGELIVNLEIADNLNVVFAPSLLKNASVVGK